MNTSDKTILWLYDRSCRDIESVGNKARNLNYLLELGEKVPYGFVLCSSMCNNIYNTRKFTEQSLLKRFYERLISQSRSGLVIVRSSSNIEDMSSNLFPGIFLSFPMISSYENLMDGILACIDAVHSPKVDSYCSAMKINASALKMAVIVQEYVIPEVSGVAVINKTSENDMRIMVECTKGSASELMQGQPPTSVIEVVSVDKIHEVTIFPYNYDIHPDDIEHKIAPAIFTFSTKVPFQDTAILEWTATSNSFDIVQFTEIGPRESFRLFGIKPPSIGYKGQAMNRFKCLGWFTKQVVFLRPDEDIDSFCNTAKKICWNPKGITVRFSHKNDIGLPRSFFKNIDDALPFLKDNWNSAWMGIIHDYMDVKRSFEVYIDHEKTILEHLPGVWETENQEAPDVAVIKNNNTNISTADKQRLCKYIYPDVTEWRSVSPTSESQMLSWVHRIDKYVSLLKRLYHESLPIICHLIEDEDDRWQFLNVRLSRTVASNREIPNNLFKVSNPNDLLMWDSATPILLDIPLNRGRESSLIMVAEKLPKGTQVYTTAGILSHPAIMLRELGVHVVHLTSLDLNSINITGSRNGCS